MAPKRKLSNDVSEKQPNIKRPHTTFDELRQQLQKGNPGYEGLAAISSAFEAELAAFSSSLTRLINSSRRKMNRNRKFPFHLLPPEIKNTIYDLILDDYFAQRKKHRSEEGDPFYERGFTHNSIPYGPSLGQAYGCAPDVFRGLVDSILPAFELFLKPNKKLHEEFASSRITRSELLLTPSVSARDGVLPSYDHKRRRIGDLDRKYGEQVCFTLSGNSPHEAYMKFRSEQICQDRLYAMGTALRRLASDTSLPNLSRVSIHFDLPSFSFFCGLFIRFDWMPVLNGLRTLLYSGKLRRFELRMPEYTRVSRWTTVLQEQVSELVGRSAGIEGPGCEWCLSDTDAAEREHMNGLRYPVSMVWTAPKGQWLAVRDSAEGVEVRDVEHCQVCGETLHEFLRPGRADSDDFVYGLRWPRDPDFA